MAKATGGNKEARYQAKLTAFEFGQAGKRETLKAAYSNSE
jgi:hypothetical protein